MASRLRASLIILFRVRDVMHAQKRESSHRRTKAFTWRRNLNIILSYYPGGSIGQDRIQTKTIILKLKCRVQAVTDTNQPELEEFCSPAKILCRFLVVATIKQRKENIQSLQSTVKGLRIISLCGIHQKRLFTGTALRHFPSRIRFLF